MPPKIRSQRNAEYKRHIPFPCKAVQVFHRKHDIILLKAYGILPDRIEVLQICFCRLQLHHSQQSLRRRPDEPVLQTRPSRRHTCDKCPVSFCVHTGDDSQRVLRSQRLVDHLFRIFAPIIQSLGHRAVLYGLVPDSCNSCRTVDILKKRIPIINTCIQYPHHNAAPHKLKRRICLDYTDPGVVHCLQIHQLITVGNRIIVEILQRQRL